MKEFVLHIVHFVVYAFKLLLHKHESVMHCHTKADNNNNGGESTDGKQE